MVGTGVINMIAWQNLQNPKSRNYSSLFMIGFKLEMCSSLGIRSTFDTMILLTGLQSNMRQLQQNANMLM